MITSQLFVNGIELDLLPGTVIAVTIQNYSPLSPDVVNYSFSSRIRVPITQSNKITLNYLDNLGVVSNAYKARQPARFVQNGLEIIPDGYVLILGIKDNFFELAIYAGFIDLFSTLKDKWLTDISYTDVNTGWDYVKQDALIDGQLILTAGGYDYGKFFSAIINSGSNLTYTAPDVVAVPPWGMFGYKQMLEKIFTQSGYTFDWGKLDAVVGADYKFKRLAITQGAKNRYLAYSSRFRKTKEFSAERTTNQVFNSIGNGASAQVIFDITEFPCPFWNTATASKYVVANTDTALSYFSTSFSTDLVVNIAEAGATANVYIYLNGANAAFQAVVTGNTTVSLRAIGVYLKSGDYVEVAVKQTSPNPVTITVNKGIRFYNNGTQGIAGSAAFYYNYFNEWLPEDISQLDLIKDFLFRFGQIPKQVNKKVTFKGLTEIINDQGNVNDWTGKRDKSKFDEVTYSLTNLAQLNTFLYKVSEADTLGTKYGYGDFSLDDMSLQKEKVTTSKATASGSSYFNSIKCANIPVDDAASFPGINGDYAIKKDVGMRLLMARTNELGEGTIKVGAAAARANYTVGVFFDPLIGAVSNNEPSLSFANVFTEIYTNYTIGVASTTGFLFRLKNAKLVVRYYNLNDYDIATLDPHKMIFDDGNYFMFPKLFSYVPGKITRVEMLKI